ncbi:MAG: sigma factor-like helix-turn-helix DNA-binding protein [Ilumatobacteraceae bacterium]|nr:sigma factor-like helix-turn-helix DNA-binding protein [Ilumatobacteraceae bacterium]
MQVDLAVERVRRVYEADHARLWRSVFALTGSRPLADDAVAEAFAQALRRGDRIDDVAAWVWKSAFAIARGELKQRGRTSGDPLDDRRSAAGGGDDEDIQLLLQRLSALSHDDRELIVLCHVGGWKPRELAPVLGIPAGTLRVRLHRATARAREILEGEDQS